MDGIREIRGSHQLHSRIIRRVQVGKAVFRDHCPLKADALRLPQTLFQIGHTAHLAAQTHFADGDELIADRTIQQRI